MLQEGSEYGIVAAGPDATVFTGDSRWAIEPSLWQELILRAIRRRISVGIASGSEIGLRVCHKDGLTSGDREGGADRKPLFEAVRQTRVTVAENRVPA